VTAQVRRRQAIHALGAALASFVLLGELRQGAVAVAGNGPLLYVFVPMLIRARALELLLALALPGVEIVVFARFADLTSAIATRAPAAVLSPGAGLESLGLRPSLQGTGADGLRERYVILARQNVTSLDAVAERGVGVVDMVGRRALPGLVRSMLKLTGEPKVLRVLKLSDLLPLLTLDLAGGILLPERFSAEVRGQSRLPLGVLGAPAADLPRTALAFSGTERPEAIELGLRRAPPAALTALGVQGWQGA
jgi:hypothetical protein